MPVDDSNPNGTGTQFDCKTMGLQSGKRRIDYEVCVYK